MHVRKLALEMTLWKWEQKREQVVESGIAVVVFLCHRLEEFFFIVTISFGQEDMTVK